MNIDIPSIIVFVALALPVIVLLMLTLNLIVGGSTSIICDELLLQIQREPESSYVREWIVQECWK